MLHEPASSALTAPRGSLRYSWVDVAKGICIIAVVCLYGRKELMHYLGDAGWLTPWAAFAKPFRMPDFFLLSGLFLGVVIDRPWRNYLDTKVIHYLYFLLLWVGLIQGHEWLFDPNFAGYNDSPLRALRRYIYYLYQPDHMLWFIQILPMYFVVTRLMLRVPKPALLALAAALMLSDQATPVAVWNNFCSYYVYFVLGYACAQYIFDFADLVAARRFVSVPLLSGWVVLNAWAVQVGWTETALGALVFGVLGISAVISVSRLAADVPALAFLRFLGANSIVVYLGFYIPLHVMVLAYRASGCMLNIQLVSTALVALSIAAPVLLFLVTRETRLRLLFARPSWAHVVAPRRATMLA